MWLNLLISIVFTALLIGVVYYRNYQKKEMLFTFFLFNIAIFFIVYFLHENEVGLGAAFGLFAVFSMLRFRTETLSTKEMTYLVLVISVALLSALIKEDTLSLLETNGVLFLVTFILESKLIFKKENWLIVQYEKIQFLKAGNNTLLLQDLTERTGHNIFKAEVESIDFVNDSARLKVYYHLD